VANPVVHFEIAGKDGKKLHEFYSALFGWKINADNPMNYGMVDTGGDKGIPGGIFTSQDNTTVATVIYVETDNLTATLAQAESLGGKTIVPPTEVPNMVTFAQFVDPQGNVIGLVKSTR
jgi:uncharacterized protein